MNRIPVSSLAASQFPEFIREDFPRFVAFLQAYYEFLDNQVGDNIASIKDVDSTLDQFLRNFREMYALNVPIQNISTRDFILKSRELYAARGSEASFRLLMRMLFGKEIGVFYPSTVILKASDGKWTQETSLIGVNFTGGNGFDLVGKEVTATIADKIFRFEITRARALESGVFELYFDKKNKGLFTTTGQFQSGGISFQIAQRANRISVTTSATGFAPGQLIDITGTGIKVRVKTVDSTGRVTKLEVVEFGQGNTNFISGTYSGIGVSIALSYVNEYPGYYAASDGFLSDVNRLQDNFFYQQFSYVIRIDEQLNAYRDVVERLLHPAGMKLFGEFELTNKIDIRAAIRYINRILSVYVQDDAIVADDVYRELIKPVVEEVNTLSDIQQIALQKVISITTTASDFGQLIQLTAGDYTDFPPGNANSYFSQIGADQYSTGSSTLTRTW